MPRITHPPADHTFQAAPSPRPRRRLFWTVSTAVGLFVILALVLWNVFFHYVGPTEMLIVVAKNGEELGSEQVLARPGQKGIQEEVLGEGWHFVMPIANTTERKPNVLVPPGQVGIVTALGGVAPRDSREMAVQPDERGVRPDVLPPGMYRLNPYGYKVDLVAATVVQPGYVGVLRRQLGKANAGRFADAPGDKGILRDVLQPGLYYINTKEFEVIHCEVGIDQTSYRDERAMPKLPHHQEPIHFQSRDGYEINIECTIEWEVLPKDAPALAAEFGAVQRGDKLAVDFDRVELNVIDQQVRKISRDRGFNFGAQDFLEGSQREAFQGDFTRELQRVCAEKNVTVRSAFIRQIIIPDEFLQQKRAKQMAAELKLTNEAQELTAATEAEVERERKMVEQAVAKVKAETARLVAGTNRQKDNVISATDAEIEAIKADYGARIALLDAERKTVLGQAEAEAKRLREIAKGSLYKMKLDVFGNDGAAYLRYTMAQGMRDNLVLRLFHSGPGTLWTNLDGKHMNLLLPTPGTPSNTPAEDVKPVK